MILLLISCNDNKKDTRKPYSGDLKDAHVKNGSSGIDAYAALVNLDNISSIQTKRLTIIGQLWGFLKYYHPAVTSGNYNWDAELFKMLPKALAASSKSSFDRILESWVDSLGVVKPCSQCFTRMTFGESAKLTPDFSWMVNGSPLKKNLIHKLAVIFDNRLPGQRHYAGIQKNGNPAFRNEDAYENMICPSSGFRLLSLFRYWNIIQYFYPYKYLIGEDWEGVLPEFIPKFIHARDSTAYTFACLELIGRINDSHANIWGDNDAMNNFFGKYFPPVKTSIVENRLVVTGFYLDTLGIRDKIRAGDVITKINGQPVDSLISQNLKYVPASNYEVKLRDLPLGVLMRSRTDQMVLKIIRGNDSIDCKIPCIYRNILFNRNPVYAKTDPGFRILPGHIGFMACSRFHADQMDEMKSLFKNTIGMVIDMRGYPPENLLPVSDYLKPAATKFVKFTLIEPNTPGLFLFTSIMENGEINSESYGKPVVIIVNAETQSQAEFSTMFLKQAPRVSVIGSTTAGADGDMSLFMLPGGISTAISGIGVYYPDGGETQRKGVRIDDVVRPTLKGIKEGRDELLERATEILTGKSN